MSTTPAETPAEPPAAEPTPEPEKQTAAPTQYVVLVHDNSDDSWKVGSTVSARSTQAAVREHIKSTGMESGTLLAVPARSWQPVTFKTETQAKLKFS